MTKKMCRPSSRSTMVEVEMGTRKRTTAMRRIRMIGRTRTDVQRGGGKDDRPGLVSVGVCDRDHEPSTLSTFDCCKNGQKVFGVVCVIEIMNPAPYPLLFDD